MPLAAGQTLTHYEILGSLGAGGMGEVYRARDTRLDREVAIKVLPEAFVEDEDRLRRFEREAKTLASLNHPNLAHVYGIDQVGDTCFMAMELVPGDDLSVRLKRGPLPIAEAIDVCRRIAEGLEAAHEAGVVHRDLKPANVHVTPDGAVKVLDFGLAKPMGPEPIEEDSTQVTVEGTVLGTPPYLSPEQARGRPIDRRTDIWAFGCVLYECLTGTRAFSGSSLPDLLAAIVSAEPDWSGLPESTPSSVRELLARCLRKDPRNRVRDIGDARIALEESGDEPPSAEATRQRSGLVAALASATLLATVAALFGWTREESKRSRFELRPITYGYEWETSPSWSPESDFVAYERMVAGSSDIYIRHVTGEMATERAGGPGDQHSPRWSPDGNYLAYVSSLEPGAPVYLVRPHDDSDPFHLIDTNTPPLVINVLSRSLGDRPWLDDDNLLVSRAFPSGQVAIHRVNRHTGKSEQISFPPVGVDDIRASVSFEGDQIVFERRTHGRGSLWTIPTSGGPASVLLDDGYDNKAPAWRPGGRHVLFFSNRGSYEDLWEFDIASGETRPITTLTKNMRSFSVSKDDSIAISTTWHDTFLWSKNVASGEEKELTRHNGDNFGARYSPDDRYIAYHSNRQGNSDIWRLDLETGRETNLTQDPSMDVYPDWSPQGGRLVFVSDREGEYNLWTMNRDGTHLRQIVDEPIGVRGTNIVNAALIARWSPDGKRIAFIKAGEEGNAVWTVDPDGEGARQILENVHGFDWLGDRRVLVSRRGGPDEYMHLYAIDLDSGAEAVLFEGPHMEVDVAPDGSAVAFCTGSGHLGMKPFVLELEPPAEPTGLPRAGKQMFLYDLELQWHVHMGGWSGDSKSLVFTYDRDYCDIYELVETR